MHGGAFGTQNWLFVIPEFNLGISIITNQSDLETADKLLETLRRFSRLLSPKLLSSFFILLWI
jgi:hypothetical protein